ncbi:tRNA lysidine(34) synthetase TilS [Flavihumibacter profundi]|jgi:tRNA(Ile)-lysidine synthase|uniref:tRNA lysidine(34) synthetase TilS n=1 Tax=Flavihumibacter profundi TaxID=2716883 RepID=UPI001CC55DE6|nr:tRNA lysidine(34) synthetase TilS [Flavihumibacter profundi]MBZ5856440.1 tRNA lysidine(34) synthetase TilS [Flavihumibacter profundi]
MNELVKDFKDYIRNNKLFTGSNRLLVGVSGGLDSVVLCHLLKESGFYFEIAHVNFQLRGAESDRDEQFTIALAGKLNVPVHTAHLNAANYAHQHKVSVQVAARELRYDWFSGLIKDRKASGNPLDCILTAHHANDNAETILMNVFRGTGLSGLRGILPARDLIRRPLLFANRNDLLQYARQNNITWVEDSSNALDKYSRNYIRLNIIPQIEEAYPSLVKTLNESAGHLREMELFYDQAMQQCLHKIVVLKGQEQQVPVARWRKLPGAPAVLYAWLKPFGFSPAQMPEVAALAKSESGHFIDSATHRVLINRAWFVLTQKSHKDATTVLLPDEKGDIHFGGGHLHWKTVTNKQQPIPTDPEIAWVDASKIAYPLLLRPWKPGDYFYPLGMPKKKKVARFLIDIKLPRHLKEKVWVLESDRKVVWVIGHRIDDRFRIKPSTSSLLCLHFNSAL